MRIYSVIAFLIILPFYINADDNLRMVKSDTVLDSAPVKGKCQAYLGIKKNYVMKDGIYTGGYFESTSSVVVPKTHSPHDALYQMEGPGWESDKVGYRVYLDERNRTDIFGKTTPKPVLHLAGKDDLLSGNESYQKAQWWGQDIFKVGNSLGIGSVAYFINNKVVTVSETDSVKCSIVNKEDYSSVITQHFGWKPSDNKLDVQISYTIKPDSRLTEVDVTTSTPVDNICTGLADHANTTFLKCNNKDGWCYLSLWGKQSLADDNLGIAVFYNSKEIVKTTKDDLSHIVLLKPDNKNQVKYYFAACWEKETDGIKTFEAFKAYLNKVVQQLNEQDLKGL